MLKNFISFKKISHFICNFISLICSFQQCQCCECGNVSMGFWKSRVKQKSFVKSLVYDSWLNKTFVSLVISKTPYSHFLLTAFTQCREVGGQKKPQFCQRSLWTAPYKKRVPFFFRNSQWLERHLALFYHKSYIYCIFCFSLTKTFAMAGLTLEIIQPRLPTLLSK